MQSKSKFLYVYVYVIAFALQFLLIESKPRASTAVNGVTAATRNRKEDIEDIRNLSDDDLERLANYYTAALQTELLGNAQSELPEEEQNSKMLQKNKRINVSKMRSAGRQASKESVATTATSPLLAQMSPKRRVSSSKRAQQVRIPETKSDQLNADQASNTATVECVDPGSLQLPPHILQLLSPQALQQLPPHILQQLLPYWQIPSNIPQKDGEDISKAYQDQINALLKQYGASLQPGALAFPAYLPSEPAGPQQPHWHLHPQQPQNYADSSSSSSGGGAGGGAIDPNSINALLKQYGGMIAHPGALAFPAYLPSELAPSQQPHLHLHSQQPQNYADGGHGAPAAAAAVDPNYINALLRPYGMSTHHEGLTFPGYLPTAPQQPHWHLHSPQSQNYADGSSGSGSGAVVDPSSGAAAIQPSLPGLPAYLGHEQAALLPHWHQQQTQPQTNGDIAPYQNYQNYINALLNQNSLPSELPAFLAPQSIAPSVISTQSPCPPGTVPKLPSLFKPTASGGSSATPAASASVLPQTPSASAAAAPAAIPQLPSALTAPAAIPQLPSASTATAAAQLPSEINGNEILNPSNPSNPAHPASSVQEGKPVDGGINPARPPQPCEYVQVGCQPFYKLVSCNSNPNPNIRVTEE